MLKRLLAALALAASALTTHAASVDDWLRTTGPQQAHARLQALAQDHAGWRVLSLLWPQPELIQPAARALGLTTTEQAAALADALRDTLGMPRAEAFTRLTNPQPLPGVTSTAGMRRTNWADMQAAIKAHMPGDGVGWYRSDDTYALPSRAQLEHIATVQPFARWTWRETAQDCDDMVQMFRGWLASHGLGNLAIGYASIRYYTGATPTGRHAVAIAMDDGGKVWLIDPQQPGLHPVTARLGGNDLATRAQLLFVMH